MIQEIKDFINQNIKENGKGGITGTILNSVLNKIADALPTSVSAGLKNLVDGEADGSVRGVNAAENSETYMIGKNSHAEGTGTKAGGSENWIADAHAEGYETHADGNQAHAEGYGTYATHQAHAEGSRTVAKGYSSHAEGSNTKALGYNAHAEGESTKAGSEENPSNTICAHAEGYGTHADGNEAHAEGYNTYATHQAHAEGSSCRAMAASSHAEGSSSVTLRFGAHAEGVGTIAGTDNSGYAAHAEGQRTKALGDYSHAEGTDTEATKDSAHAEGANTKATGYQSHAEGAATEASGSNSHAEGVSTIASGYAAHAEGLSTVASGVASHAAGSSTSAIGNCQTAIGFCNKEIDAYFSVGDGAGYDKRSDAFRIEKDSRVMIKNNAGEEVHLQDFEPRSCIIRWQPKSEIKDNLYFLYHDLIYIPFFDNIQNDERHVLHLDWLYEHQPSLDNAEYEDDTKVGYIGAERLRSVITVSKSGGYLYCDIKTKVVETNLISTDLQSNKFHTASIRYDRSEGGVNVRGSRVYIQDYIYSERFNYETGKGTHFKLTLLSAIMDGEPFGLGNFVFADGTGNVDYSRDENGAFLGGDIASSGSWSENKDKVWDEMLTIKTKVGTFGGEASKTVSFDEIFSDHSITIGVATADYKSADGALSFDLRNSGQVSVSVNVAKLKELLELN